MWRVQFRNYFLPGPAEADPGFRQDIQKQALLSVQVVGGAAVGLACFLNLARLFIAPDPATLKLRVAEAALIVLLGIGMLRLAATEIGRRHARAFAILGGWLISAILIWWSLLLFPPGGPTAGFIPFQMTLVLLVGVTAVPMQPLQTFSLGTAISLTYVLLSAVAAQLYYPGARADAINLLFMVALTMLSTALTAVVYDQRLSRYEAHVRSLKSADDVREAQARVLLSENAASLGRLAAAVSHELNSPVGALLSGVDTLLLLAARQATSNSEDQQRLVTLQAELRRTIKQSADRLREIVARMQRFTNMDRADVQKANVNELLGDVALLVQPELKKKDTRIELDLQPVPEIVCRPQQLSAVFGNLVSNAAAAVNGDGRIHIASKAVNGSIHVEIKDNGHGVDAAEIATIFEPGFKVKDGRVSSGNWSLFSSRQIVREHGGDILIASGSGTGTSVRVTLPFETKTMVGGVS